MERLGVNRNDGVGTDGVTGLYYGASSTMTLNQDGTVEELFRAGCNPEDPGIVSRGHWKRNGQVIAVHMPKQAHRAKRRFEYEIATFDNEIILMPIIDMEYGLRLFASYSLRPNHVDRVLEYASKPDLSID